MACEADILPRKLEIRPFRSAWITVIACGATVGCFALQSSELGLIIVAVTTLTSLVIGLGSSRASGVVDPVISQKLRYLRDEFVRAPGNVEQDRELVCVGLALMDLAPEQWQIAIERSRGTTIGLYGRARCWVATRSALRQLWTAWRVADPVAANVWARLFSAVEETQPPRIERELSTALGNTYLGILHRDRVSKEGFAILTAPFSEIVTNCIASDAKDSS